MLMGTNTTHDLSSNQRWRWWDKYLLPQILAEYGAFFGNWHVTSLEKLLRNCLVIWVRPRFKFSIAWIQGSPIKSSWRHCESALKCLQSFMINTSSFKWFDQSIFHVTFLQLFRLTLSLSLSYSFLSFRWWISVSHLERCVCLNSWQTCRSAAEESKSSAHFSGPLKWHLLLWEDPACWP